MSLIALVVVWFLLVYTPSWVFQKAFDPGLRGVPLCFLEFIPSLYSLLVFAFLLIES